VSRVALATLNAKFVHSSLALRCLRAVTEKDHDVKLLEFTIHDPVEVIVGTLFEQNPDVIGFSCYIWNIEETAKLISTLKKVLPTSLIVLGGPEVSYDTDHFMHNMAGVDVIVVGEGEATFPELLSVHQAKGDLKSVSGLVFRNELGELIHTPTRAKIDFAKIDRFTPYDDQYMHELANRIVYYEASRGCPFSCQFCLSSIESGVRYAALERVQDDLRRLIQAGVRQIKFVDRTFNLRRDIALAIFTFLIEYAGQTTFHFEITGDILKPDIVNWLCQHAPAGLFRFEIGVQSTNDATNDIVKRRQNFAKLSHTVETIAESGKIIQHLDLIAGLPEENYETFQTTFNDVFALRPDELQLGFLKLLRGTGLRHMADRYGYQYMETAPYEMLSNQDMSYQEVLRLKRLEDVLEKYYNSGRFRHIVAYATKELFETPFAFFQSFGDYWNERGYARIGHQPIHLVLYFRDFLEQRGCFDEVAQALLRADYLLREKLRPRSLWWQQEVTSVSQTALSAASLEPALPDKEWHKLDFQKRVVVDRISRKAWHILVGESGAQEQFVGDELQTWVDIWYVYPSAVGHPTMHCAKTSVMAEPKIRFST